MRQWPEGGGQGPVPSVVDGWAHGGSPAHGGLLTVSPGLSGRFHAISLQPPDHAATGGCHGLPTPTWPSRGRRAPCRPPPCLGRGAQATALLTVRDTLRQRVTVRTGWGAAPGPSAWPEQPGKERGSRRLPPQRKEPLSLPARPSVRPSVQSRHPCLSKALTTTPAPGWSCAVTLLRGCLPGAREGRGRGGGAAATRTQPGRPGTQSRMTTHLPRHCLPP